MSDFAKSISRMQNLPEIPASRRIIGKLEDLERTCFAVPSQWEAKTDNGYHLYIRYRGGHFSVGIAETPMAAVTDSMLSPIISHEIGDWLDGTMHDADMLYLLSEYFNVESWLMTMGG